MFLFVYVDGETSPGLHSAFLVLSYKKNFEIPDEFIDCINDTMFEVTEGSVCAREGASVRVIYSGVST